MSKYKLKFEKSDKEDFLELPVLYSSKEGLSEDEAFKEYLKAYEFTRKKLDSYLENLSKLKNQLEEEFKDVSSYFNKFK